MDRMRDNYEKSDLIFPSPNFFEFHSCENNSSFLADNSRLSFNYFLINYLN